MAYKFLDQLKEELKQGQLALLIGADWPASLTGFLSRQELSAKLSSRYGQSGSLAMQVQSLYQYIAAKDVIGQLQRWSKPMREPAKILQSLGTWPVELYITTAYHNGLFNALKEKKGSAPHVVVPEQELAFKNPALLVHLYGTLYRPFAQPALSQKELHRLSYARHSRWGHARNALKNRPILCVGFDWHGDDFRRVRRQILNHRTSKNPNVYILSMPLKRVASPPPSHWRLIEVRESQMSDTLQELAAPFKKRGAPLSLDERLAQATCAVLIEGQVAGTAWLLSEEGHLLTAGHVLGLSNPASQVQVQFPKDRVRDADRIEWDFQRKANIDFAVLKLANPPIDRYALSVSLARTVSGTFRLRGYGKALQGQSVGKGKFLGAFKPLDPSGNPLFQLSSRELSQKGYSGGAVFSDELQAVVAIQIEITKTRGGAGRDTLFAMPLYRIAQRWDALSQIAEACCA